ncbi:uncharacterized protein Z519_05883 [Cladophialophora bantiana CBS 173.52]|uniref:Cyclase n=1 Tax=Cladophialophora bantiana (strain ATCC 10958 / CBS 173.52 / CDC B-1940 / NIH 8579) TaxID=1442370 RepID=A0A0D2HJ04_CLAB1|nr:uncharacterized protein Z519_05883 [Cladophialophora bantiana CBS 173.52]KIW93278.1 hypothetical protein Z519_05883 [Cladophialophora bantiana CBS 173.52]
MSKTSIPHFDDLPRVPGQPQGNSWGLWGQEDQLGTLNKITPESRKRAAQEVKAGISVSLDLPLDAFDYVIANRRLFKQTVIDFKKMNMGVGHDDELQFNTQSSSQWDGLTHCGLQEQEVYYNGLKHEDIMKNRDGRNGIHKWVEAGGIVGRGVLIDYVRWRQETGQSPVPADSPYSITVSELKAVANHQKVEFQPGDILLLRGGFTLWYNAASPEERKQKLDQTAFIGVERSMEMARFLWNEHFAAVATDSIGFEQCPVPFGQKGAVVLHEWILAHWGMPLGELWNLEGLSELCKKQNQWSFLFTSAPLYVRGGVGSPPNAIALL